MNTCTILRQITPLACSVVLRDPLAAIDSNIDLSTLVQAATCDKISLCESVQHEHITKHHGEAVSESNPSLAESELTLAIQTAATAKATDYRCSCP
jgi:hypothetical protein